MSKRRARNYKSSELLGAINVFDKVKNSKQTGGGYKDVEKHLIDTSGMNHEKAYDYIEAQYKAGKITKNERTALELFADEYFGVKFK